MANDNQKEFWDAMAEAFVHPLRSEALLGRFVSEPNLTGAYAESWVRWLVRTMARRYEVSTGAIIRSSDRVLGRRGNQCDIIIWDPSELPAPLAVGDFALVPSFSARSVIEVKRTTSNPEELTRQLEERREAIPREYQCYVLGVVVRHRDTLFDSEVHPDWVEGMRGKRPAITRLLSEDGQPDTNGIFSLIYMLSHLSGHRGVI